jgi:hypothetical protein
MLTDSHINEPSWDYVNVWPIEKRSDADRERSGTSHADHQMALREKELPEKESPEGSDETRMIDRGLAWADTGTDGIIESME